MENDPDFVPHWMKMNNPDRDSSTFTVNFGLAPSPLPDVDTYDNFDEDTTVFVILGQHASLAVQLHAKVSVMIDKDLSIFLYAVMLPFNIVAIFLLAIHFERYF